jgi:Na+:H+ antiporter
MMLPVFDIFTFLLVLSALFAYINSRWLKLPPMIAFMAGSLSLSLLLLLGSSLGFEPAIMAIKNLKSIDFSSTVLYGILSFLLFAGSLQLDIRDLAKEKWVIFALATVGVIISTFVVGLLMHYVFQLVGIGVPIFYSLAFGALISPTDPVIVIGLLKGSRTSGNLRMKVMGEALFNDGIAIVLFTILFALGSAPNSVTFQMVATLFAQQMVGSILLGLLTGWITYRLLSHVTEAPVQLFLTLGAVAFSYDIATWFGTSGPITVVILGLFVKNYRGRRPIPDEPFSTCIMFWTWLDEFLNAALFVMMGLELLSVRFTKTQCLAGALAILVVLFGRLISVWIPIRIFKFFRPFTKRAVLFLTWVGLKGGIPLALALSLPQDKIGLTLVSATYMVVIFSIFIQGLSFRWLLRKTEASETH